MKLTENYIITVPIGKLIKRLSDGALFGRKYLLGYIWYKDGKKLDTPYKERFADFEEVDDPDKDLISHRIGEVGVDDTNLILSNLVKEVITLSDNISKSNNV